MGTYPGLQLLAFCFMAAIGLWSPFLLAVVVPSFAPQPGAALLHGWWDGLDGQGSNQVWCLHGGV